MPVDILFCLKFSHSRLSIYLYYIYIIYIHALIWVSAPAPPSPPLSAAGAVGSASPAYHRRRHPLLTRGALSPRCSGHMHTSRSRCRPPPNVLIILSDDQGWVTSSTIGETALACVRTRLICTAWPQPPEALTFIDSTPRRSVQSDALL